MNRDLRLIKRHYGENMMHLCKKLFPTLIEYGVLFEILSSKFAYSKALYNDLLSKGYEAMFKNYIYSFFNPEVDEVVTDKSVKKLFDEAGYNFYECYSESDIQSFRKYYSEGEELCTFKQGGRLNDCFVFFAVKKDVDTIKREDFLYPKRQDRYGTSVISIQFSRGDVNTLSIKNRYNHMVDNPDATFSNYLENIIPGLTASFKREYNFNINQNDSGFDMPGYFLGNDGKYYKSNYEINNIHYCENNIIIDNGNVIRDYEAKERYVLLDYFILDLKEKTIKLYDYPRKSSDGKNKKGIIDSFIDTIGVIDKIEINKDGDRKLIVIYNREGKKAIIALDELNRIVGYQNEYATSIGDNFLVYNKAMKYLVMDEVIEVGNACLSANEVLEQISMLRVQNIKNAFLYHNKMLRVISFPLLKDVGNNCLRENKIISDFNAQNLTQVGFGFLFSNEALEVLNFPLLIQAGHNFIGKNKIISVIYMPSLVKTSQYFLNENKLVKEADFSSLEEAGNYFFRDNDSIVIFDAPNLVKIGIGCLKSAKDLKVINAPKLIAAGVSSHPLLINIAKNNREISSGQVSMGGI